MSQERGATYTPDGFPIGETLVGVGAVASRPDADDELTPRFWFDPTTGLLYVDGSGTWYALIPGLQASNTYEGNLSQVIVQDSGGLGWWALRRDGEAADRIRVIDTGVAIGGGSGALDAVMRRHAAGDIRFFSATVGGSLIPVGAGTPTADDHLVPRSYGDARYQGLDADLTAIAALTTTAFGRGLLELANAAAGRTALDVPSTSEAVLDTLYDANTIVKADSDNTPAALTVAEDRLVGRLAGDVIDDLTPAQVRTLLDVPTNAQAILDTLVDAKGDLLVGTAADTPAVLSVGADHSILTADSTQTSGHRWVASAPVVPFPCSVVNLNNVTGGGALGNANDGHYYRNCGAGGSITAVGLQVGTQNGNISVAAFTRSGSGRAAQPTGGQICTSGSVACPASGYAEVSVGGTFAVRVDDFMGVSASGTTATLFGIQPTTTLASQLGDGTHYRQATAHPLPSTPSSLISETGRGYLLIGET